MEQKRKMRVKEVSNVYGISISTIWNYVKKGKLKTYKPSERITLFDVDELEQFFNKRP